MRDVCKVIVVIIFFVMQLTTLLFLDKTLGILKDYDSPDPGISVMNETDYPVSIEYD